jgi:hypothetical protein
MLDLPPVIVLEVDAGAKGKAKSRYSRRVIGVPLTAAYGDGSRRNRVGGTFRSAASCLVDGVGCVLRSVEDRHGRIHPDVESQVVRLASRRIQQRGARDGDGQSVP